MTDAITGIGPDTTLADIIRVHPGSERIFDKYEIDYCCHGHRPLAEAATETIAGTDGIIAEILAVEAEEPRAWDHLGPAELTVHVEEVHHAFLHQEMPRIDMLAQKVASVHGGNHPELREVAQVYGQLRAELEPHLATEENTIFPAIRSLAAGDETEIEDLDGPISELMSEHDDAGRLLERLRELTGGYETPADGCASYHALYDGLAALESDTHLHIHIENNIMFPAVQELEDVNRRTA